MKKPLGVTAPGGPKRIQIMFTGNHTTATAVMQHLPPLEQERVYRLMERRAQRNPRFRDRLNAAKAKAEADERDYDAWLIAQYEAAQALEDLPW